MIIILNGCPVRYVPFVAVYFIVAELFNNVANPALSDMGKIRNWGLWALVSLVGALVFLYGGTMASHVSAFRILYSLRVRLAGLPMGYHTRQSSGAIKKMTAGSRSRAGMRNCWPGRVYTPICGQ